MEYAQWLRGEEGREVLRQEEEDMVALRNYWADPDLDADEAFLRDYILKKGYLDKEDDNRWVEFTTTTKKNITLL